MAGKVTKKLLDRFMAKVSPEPNSGCWLWVGAITAQGYGSIGKGVKTYMAHRVSYELFKGPIPAELHIDHLCRVRCCVNPDHLEAVTRAVNTQRGAASFDPWRSRLTHCKNGHAFDGQNTRIKFNPDGSGHRVCRICTRVYQRDRRTQKRLETKNG